MLRSIAASQGGLSVDHRECYVTLRAGASAVGAI
jgi:hypothetical protein